MNTTDALRRAFYLGQLYWQQADSESYSQNAKSYETQTKFEQLLAELSPEQKTTLAEARQLLHTASIRLSRWMGPDEDPRKQIIDFLERTS